MLSSIWDNGKCLRWFLGGVRWGGVLFSVLLFVSCVFFGVYFGMMGGLGGTLRGRIVVGVVVSNKNLHRHCSGNVDVGH